MGAETLLRELPGDAGLTLEIVSGTEHWRGGEIALTVDGAGAADVRHRRAGEERHYRGTLDRPALEALIGRLRESGLDAERPRRTVYEPDEHSVTVALRRGDEELYTAAIPEGDRHDDDRLDALLGEYERLVAQLTDGALPFGEAAAPR
jgi:hypothetical protein